MDLNKLRYFYRVAYLCHVTRAAEELHLAQPALTKSIKQLEEELGVMLFYKAGRNIALTPIGRQLKSRLDGIMPTLDALPAEIEAWKGEARRTVRLNVLAASTAVTDAVVNYKKQHANAVFQLIQNEEETDCDISVTTNAADAAKLPHFRERCVIEETIYLAVPKSSVYAALPSIDLTQVRDEGFVHLAGSRLFRAVCDHFCAAAGFHPKTVFESDSILAVKNIIGAGAGVGFWPAFSWGKATHLDVSLVPIRTPDCRRELIIGLHDSAPRAGVATDFYQYLTDFMQNRRRRQ